MANSASLEIAEQVLPRGLLATLTLLFDSPFEGAMLVGGTALAGFYASHRRSDDLDIFTSSELDFAEARRRVEDLVKHGVELTQQHSSPHFHRSVARHHDYSFTVDVVRDENLFRVGAAHLAGNIRVADLCTLMMTKAATLVSRCSEKDLFDLLWLDKHFEPATPERLLMLGQEIDGGMDAESVLMSLAGAQLSEKSCHFGLREADGPRSIFNSVVEFKQSLEQAFARYLETLPMPPLGHALKALKPR
jgi:hypothetical protein